MFEQDSEGIINTFSHEYNVRSSLLAPVTETTNQDLDGSKGFKGPIEHSLDHIDNLSQVDLFQRYSFEKNALKSPQKAPKNSSEKENQSAFRGSLKEKNFKVPHPLGKSQIINLNSTEIQNQSQSQSQHNSNLRIASDDKENILPSKSKTTWKEDYILEPPKALNKEDEAVCPEFEKLKIRSDILNREPILEGSPSKYQDTSKEHFNQIEGLSDIDEEESKQDTNNENFGELKEETKVLEQFSSDFEKRMGWIDFSSDIREKALKGILKETYNALKMNPDFWNRSQYENNAQFFHIHFCITFIQYLSFLYKEALPGLITMEQFYNKNKDTKTLDLGNRDIGFLYTNLGTCYSNTGEPAKAICYLEKAKELLKDMTKKQPFIIAHCLSRLGQHHLRYNSLDRALQYFEEAVIITMQMDEVKKYGDPTRDFYLMWCYLDLSDVWLEKGETEENYENAEKNLRLGLEKLQSEKAENTYFLARVKRNEAKLCLFYQQKDKALKYYEEALKIIDETLPEGNQLKGEYEAERNLIIEPLKKNPALLDSSCNMNQGLSQASW